MRRSILAKAVMLLPLLWPLAARADEWRLDQASDGVRVYMRPVAGSPVDEVRVEAVIDFPPERIFAVLTDVDAYPQVMPPTVKARRIKGTGDSIWYYMEINPPVVSRRFYCMHVRHAKLAGGGMRTDWSLANELCPAQQGTMVRMEENRGSWTLTPLGDGRTRVVYQAHTDPGGQIPGWMVNRVQGKELVGLVGTLRKATGLPRYALRNR